MRSGLLGQIVTPNSRNTVVEGAVWVADNGCFSDRWDESKWLRFLQQRADVPNCLFAVVPDVVCDAAATDERWAKYAPMVRSLGYRACYVTQNGCAQIPDDAEAVFTGGDDEWKLGVQAQRLVVEAKRRGLHCHMGRVNSRRRVRIAALNGYDSVDGTYLRWGPDVNLPKMLGWMHPEEPNLWGVG